MKEYMDKYRVHITEKEMDHLRQRHPVLLDQALGYGYEKIGNEHHFYNQIEVMVDNIKMALEDNL